MSRSDMLPFWTDAYLADTTHLDLKHHGAYFLLMMKAWRSGTASLPDDDMFLRNTLSISQKQWKEIKPYVMAFWTLKDNVWTQKRLSESWNERQEFIAKQKERAKTSSDKKAKDKSQNGLPKCQGIDLKKDNKNNADISAIAEAEAEAGNTVLLSAREVSKIQDRLMMAAGDGVKPHSPDIAIIQEPLRWITGQNPCDFEQDVLPTIQRIALRNKNSPKGSWSYFRDAVMDARDARLAGNPKPKEAQDGKQRHSTFTSKVSEIGNARRDVWSKILDERENDGVAAPVREPSGLCDSKAVGS